MAEYTARWNEIEKSLKAVEEAEKIGFNLTSLVKRTRYKQFKESLLKYTDWRDKALNSALPILKNESTSVTGSAQKDKWDNHFVKQGQEALKMILSFVPDDDYTPKLRLYAESLATQESAFFSKIGSTPLAWFQGKLQEYTYEFYKEMNSLESKWKDLGSKDKSVDAKVKKTSEQVNQIFKNVVEYLANKERHGEKLLLIAVENAKSAPGMPVLASVSATIHEMLAKAVEFQKDLDGLVKDYTDAYKSQETIVILFTQIRNGVNRFLDKTNLDTASDEFEEISKNSIGVAKQCPTKGQQEDAVKFVEKGIKTVKDIYEDFKKQYEEFVKENKGIFVGPVGDKSIEEILEKKDIEYSWQQISRFNIQQKLKEIHKDTIKAWHVNIDGLTDEQKMELEDFWKIEVEKLGRGLTKVADSSAMNRMKQVLVEKWRLFETRIKNSKGGLQ